MTAVAGEVSHMLITERVLMSALREQDIAAAAVKAKERAEFLSNASLRFGVSLDQELTYDAIAGIMVPMLNAWCIVDVVLVGGAVRRLAVVHPDPEKRDVAAALAGRWKPPADDPIGVPAIRERREAVLVPAQDQMLAAAAGGDPDTLCVLQWLGAGELLIVPIIEHHILYGAITFVRSPGTAAYTPDDVELAKALAIRCAQALESARLYAAARAAWSDAEAARAESVLANATKSHFLSTMSHELRTPLNAIGGYAQLLEMGVRGPVNDQQRADLASIQRSQKHLLSLVDSVLNYAQLDAGRMVYSPEDLPLLPVIYDAHSFVAPQMVAKGIQYDAGPCDPDIIVRADPQKVRQIIVNLLGNATKFTPSGGSVTLSCERGAATADALGSPRPMVAVRVADTGVGIPIEKLQSVFDPFVQVNRGLTTSDVGVGLGLAISRELARGMGGELTVRSNLGSGSVFELTLPLATPNDFESLT